MTTKCEATERPILFSGSMILAILDGRKTQTRRMVRPQPEFSEGGTCWFPTIPIDLCGRRTKALAYAKEWHLRKGLPADFLPYGQPGDRLWCRETWRCFGGQEYEYQRKQRSIIYRATAEAIDSGPWRPSIFMPRWASRLMLEVTRVRIERLWDITEEDAQAEGVKPAEDGKHRTAYQHLWDEINGRTDAKAWDKNPWVWAVDFNKVEAESGA